MRRWMTIALGLAVTAAVVIGLVQASGSAPERDTGPVPDQEATVRELRSAPAPLAALYARAGELVPATPKAFAAVVDGLEGHPAVINLWGSWCTPCRREFPVLQRAAADLGTRVAFLGINGMDPQDQARAFLADTPLPYPSYVDRGGFAFAKQIGASVNGYPTTIFVDRAGKVAYVKAGEYRTGADLRDDIRRYLDV